MISPFVEDIGEIFEVMHLGRTPGRVFGYLLTCDASARTAEAAATALNLSRGSVSTALTTLKTVLLIERVMEPGERRHYYAARPGVWSRLFAQQMVLVSRIHQIAARAETDASESGHGDVASLGEMKAFYAYLDQHMPELVAGFEDAQGAGPNR